MAGFLDKNTRVIDMVLTDYGKELYSKGELEFSFYAFSDDEIDYDPYISDSGSLSETELKQKKDDQIEATLVREATTGYQKNSDFEGKDYTNIQNLLFTMPQSQTFLPISNVVPNLESGSIEIKQQSIVDLYITTDQFGNVISEIGPFNRGFKKFNATNLTFDFDTKDFFETNSTEGSLIRMFLSESNGLIELKPKRDKEGTLSYLADIRLFVDDETMELKTIEADKIEALEKSVGFFREKEQK